jgi:L-cysteine desulfidase
VSVHKLANCAQELTKTLTDIFMSVGKTAEETIDHLSRISEIGMAKADDTMLGIMMEKSKYWDIGQKVT